MKYEQENNHCSFNFRCSMLCIITDFSTFCFAIASQKFCHVMRRNFDTSQILTENPASTLASHRY
jgi:hypothetical protein